MSMRNFSFSKGITCLISLALLPSCLTGDLKDMHNDTHQMAGETKELVGNTADVDVKSTDLVKQTGNLVSQTRTLTRLTGNLSGKMTQVSETTDATFLDLRQGDSRNIRESALRTMERATNLPEKLDEAAQYFQAMEFQLWRGQGSDTEALRESLYLDAFRQFFYDVKRYAPHGELDIAPTSTDPNQEDLNALAATMHFKNQKLVLMARQTGRTPDTVLSLIENTLLERRAVNAGEIPWGSLPRYQQEILENADLAVYMLRLRTSFIPVILLSEISTINDVLHFDAPIVGRIEILPELNGMLDLIRPFRAVGLRKGDLAPLDRDLDWINETNREYDFLQQTLGINPKVAWTVRRLYVELKLPRLPEPPSSSTESNAPGNTPIQQTGDADSTPGARETALQELIAGIRAFRGRFQR